jgi:hypothetical protein
LLTEGSSIHQQTARGTNSMPLSVCVYGSSSRSTPEAYKAAARTLGAALAERDHLCINGAGAEGAMGALNEACKAAGGRVRGVCHKMFVDGPITALFEGLELIQRADQIGNYLEGLSACSLQSDLRPLFW